MGKINPRELKIGTMIEKREHGFSIPISRKIARDHIKKYPKYHTHKRFGLIAVERMMNRQKG